MFASRFCKSIYGSLFLALVLVLPSAAQQSATGDIGGTIIDPGGKIVAQVVVTLTNVAQGTVRTFTTHNSGEFNFAALEAANYTLSVAAPAGFAPWHEAVKLEVGQTLNIPVRLSLSAAKVDIEVNSGSQIGVNTTSSDLGDVISSRQIDTLPLNGRNYLELAYLVPGNAPAPNFDPTKENTVVVSSAGQVGRGGNVMIDGADNNDDAVGGSLVNIPEDAVQEFQIASNRFSAGPRTLRLYRRQRRHQARFEQSSRRTSPFTNETEIFRDCPPLINPSRPHANISSPAIRRRRRRPPPSRQGLVVRCHGRSSATRRRPRRAA